MEIKNIFNIFNKKIDAVIVVDISSNLKLLNIELRTPKAIWVVGRYINEIKNHN